MLDPASPSQGGRGKANGLRKLAIVGSGPNTRDSAPWNDPSFDIWVFNEAGNHAWCKRWNAVFQMHEPEIYKGHNTKDPKHWEWLQRNHGKPIYMQEVDSDVPDSVRFPLEQAMELAGVPYFETTFAYMAALAILQGYDRVDIYGIDLSYSEYNYQAGCWRFWIGFLKGRLGAENVGLYSGQSLFEGPLYGYEGSFAFGSDFFAERAKLLSAEWNAVEKNTENIKKAIGRAVHKADFDEVQRLTMKLQEAAIKGGELAGALAEAERYQAFGDRYADRGGFEYAAAKAQRDGEARKPFIWHLGGMIEYSWNAWKQTSAPQPAEQMLKFIERMAQTAYDVGALLGTYKENISYIIKYDQTAQANGVLGRDVVNA